MWNIAAYTFAIIQVSVSTTGRSTRRETASRPCRNSLGGRLRYVSIGRSKSGIDLPSPKALVGIVPSSFGGVVINSIRTSPRADVARPCLSLLCAALMESSSLVSNHTA